MGNDPRVVNAARVSFNKEINETQGLVKGDVGLINYLANHNHDSPFFHVIVHLRIKMPIFVAREWFRHVVGFARNEVSRRYVTLPVECFIPDQIREKDKNKKQGSKDTPIEKNEECLALMKQSMENSISAYRTLLENGAAPEIARMVLPVSLMTEFVETASLAAYARLYALRNSPDAQYEIKQYAIEIGNIMEAICPHSWKALVDANEKRKQVVG
jgi:thymidylate synthase (FAD)